MVAPPLTRMIRTRNPCQETASRLRREAQVEAPEEKMTGGPEAAVLQLLHLLITLTHLTALPEEMTEDPKAKAKVQVS